MGPPIRRDTPDPGQRFLGNQPRDCTRKAIGKEPASSRLTSTYVDTHSAPVLCSVGTAVINEQIGLINPQEGVNPTKPRSCGFARLVTEKSKVHTSWRGYASKAELQASCFAFSLLTASCVGSA